jgi:hypothetical protein
MKTNLIFLLLGFTILLYSKQTLAQGETMYPIGEYYVPDVELTSATGTIQGPSNVYLGGSHASNYFKANGSSNITVKGEKVVIRRSHIGGNTQPGFRFAATSGNESMGCNFSYENGAPDVPLFEKIEFGLKLPEEIQERIDLFLISDMSAANTNHVGLNPYDPDDISVEATFVFSDDENILLAPVIFGFYYQDFEYENNSNSEPINWTTKTTKYPFRIRFSPHALGDHTVLITVKYKDANGNQQTYTPTSSLLDLTNLNGGNAIQSGILQLHFTGVANDNSKKSHNGHLEIGLHKRHLRQTKTQSSFFAIGMNLPEVPWEIDYHTKSPRKYNFHRFLLSKLASHGGNFCRIMSFNPHYAIEYTIKNPEDPYTATTATPHFLGNYQHTQKHMYELDKTVTHCENIGVFLMFCLQLQYPFFMPGVGYNPEENWLNNPYNYETGVGNSPEQFFYNPQTIHFWKNKIRYAQSRWGYSPAIGVWQLMNEINDVGKLPQYINGDTIFHLPYNLGSQYSSQTLIQGIADWHCAMATYLKSMYPQKIIAPNYTERVGVNSLNYEYDNTHECTAIDLMTYNTYNYGMQNNDGNRIRFERINDLIYKPDNTMPGTPEGEGKYSDKPLMLAEIGSNSSDTATGFTSAIEENCTDIEIHNAIWAGAMSGTIGTPLQWHRKDVYDGDTGTFDLDVILPNFEALSSFFDDIDFETHKYRPSVSKMSELISEFGNTEEDFVEMPVEIFVLQNDNSGINDHSDKGFGWVHHLKSGWKVKTNKYDNATHNCASSTFDTLDANDAMPPNMNTYKLEGFKSGNYFIEAYDTQTGNVIFSSNNNSDIHAGLNNKLQLSIPNISLLQSPSNVGDYAFKFWHVSQNGNDLRLENTFNTLSNGDKSHTQKQIVLPGNDSDFNRYSIVSIAPNPVSSIINITSLADEITGIYLFDSHGRLLFSWPNINSNSVSVPLLEFANGIYQLNVQLSTGIIKTFKVAKND